MSKITREIDRCPRGQWKVLRVNGIVEVTLGKPTIREICKAIGADTLDSVNLRDADGKRSGIVMMVDDTGFVDNRPRNTEATKLYHSVCRPGTTHPICGDVAIINDEDFA